MPYRENGLSTFFRWPLSLRLFLCFLVWLLFISWLHHRLNDDERAQKLIRMGYMPVVTNLAAPILDHVTKDGGEIRFESIKFASFAEMAEALRNDSIQVAFIIAPLAVVLRQQGADVKVVLIGNRNESTLVARKTLNARGLTSLSGSTIAVPMRYSGHNLALQREIEEKGLTGTIRVVEMNPPDMAAALTAGTLDAYFVGEPFAAQTVYGGRADVIAHAESMWPNFICNLVLVKKQWLDDNPVEAKKLVESAIRAGLWASRNPDEAARIVSGYWNQTIDVVGYALRVPKGRIIYDRFVPKESGLQEIADLMVRYQLIENADITGLVDDRLALGASTDNVQGIDTILRP